MSPTLSPTERNRLVALLGMLGSDHVGERANAGSLVSRLVRERGLTWGDVVPPALPPPPRRPVRPDSSPDAAADLALCGQRFGRLNEWERSFVLALSQRRHPLTPGQVRKLTEIADRLRREGRA